MSEEPKVEIASGDCERQFDEIRGVIQESVSIYRSDDRAEEIRARIAEFRHACGEGAAAFLSIGLDYRFGLQDLTSTCARLQVLVGDPGVAPRIVLLSMNMLAALLLKSEEWSVNVQRRAHARAFAREHRLFFEEFVVLLNWVSAIAETRKFHLAPEVVAEALAVKSTLPEEVRPTRKYQEASGRLLAQIAKVRLGEALGKTDVGERQRLVAEAVANFEAGIQAVLKADHLRTNAMIEAAEQLIIFEHETGDRTVEKARRLLEEAGLSIYAHACPACHGYFYYTKSQLLELSGDRLRRIDRRAARAHWQRAQEAAAASASHWEKHPYLQFSEKLGAKLEEKLSKNGRPRSIFLSHKGADKRRVRRFYTALKSAGYEPWLDEESLPVGSELIRSIHQGLKDSCAAVFFITRNFRDQKYLAMEADYAMHEKLDRHDEFAIITLVFRGADEKQIPDILRRYVYKEVRSDLEALTHILKGLPLRPSSPHWPDEDLAPYE